MKLVIAALPQAPRCLYPEDKPKRGVFTPIGTIEENWRKLVPFFKKPVAETGFVDPIGSLESIEKFIARVEELKLESQKPGAYAAREAALKRILEEQEKELATETDMLRANGFAGISMSSSDEDDDSPIEIADIPERTALLPAKTQGPIDQVNHDARRYGVAPSIGDMSMEEAVAMAQDAGKKYITVANSILGG